MELNPQSNPDRIIPRSKFRELTNISRTQEWRMMNAGRLPAVVVIDGRILGYLDSEYHKWLSQNTIA